MSADRDKYDPLRETQDRIAAEQAKLQAESKTTNSVDRPEMQSAEQDQFATNKEGAPSTDLTAETQPTRPEAHPKLAIRSKDIGDLVVQPEMTWRAQSPAARGGGIPSDRDEATQSPVPTLHAHTIRTVQHDIRATDAIRAASAQYRDELSSGRAHKPSFNTSAAALSDEVRPNKNWVRTAVDGIKSAFGSFISLAAKALDGLASFFEGLFGGASERKPPTQHELIAADHREVEAEKEAHCDALVRRTNDDMTNQRNQRMLQFGYQVTDELHATQSRENDRER